MLPRVVRDALRAWQFDQATELIDRAGGALDDRDAVVDAAVGASLTPPATMQTDFEGPRGFAAASAEADAELAAITAFREAVATRADQPGLLAAIGMWNSDPNAALRRAADAFEAGDLQASVESAAFAKRIWSSADEIGRNRIVAGRGVARRDRPWAVARDSLASRSRRAAPIRRHRPALTTVGGVGRRVLLGLVASLVALGGLLAPAAAPIARAAADGLDLRTAATYTIVPNRHVVRVVLDITARNNKPSVTSGGIITKYFYERARVAIQSAAKNVHATSNGAALTTTTTPSGGYGILEIRFRNSLFFQQTAAIRVTFDLPGGAPRSPSDIRVGTAFATFVAWAFGDAGSGPRRRSEGL